MSLVPTSPPTPPHSSPAEPSGPGRGPGTAPGRSGARGWAGVRLPAPAQWWRSALYEEEHGAEHGEGPGEEPGEPEWARFTTQALDHATAAPHGPGEQVRSVPGAGPEGRLVHPLWPFLTAAGIRFHAGRPAAADAAEAADRRAVWEGARRHLAAGLVALAGRTLAAELRAVRLAGGLRGDDPAARFDHFVRTQAARGALADLLCRRHPVLARLLAERCLNAVAAAGELLDRYRADRAALARLLDPGPLDGAGAQGGRAGGADGGRLAPPLPRPPKTVSGHGS